MIGEKNRNKAAVPLCGLSTVWASHSSWLIPIYNTTVHKNKEWWCPKCVCSCYNLTTPTGHEGNFSPEDSLLTYVLGRVISILAWSSLNIWLTLGSTAWFWCTLTFHHIGFFVAGTPFAFQVTTYWNMKASGFTLQVVIYRIWQKEINLDSGPYVFL